MYQDSHNLGHPCNPTLLSIYYVLEPNISGEGDGKREKKMQVMIEV